MMTSTASAAPSATTNLRGTTPSSRRRPRPLPTLERPSNRTTRPRRQRRSRRPRRPPRVQRIQINQGAIYRKRPFSRSSTVIARVQNFSGAYHWCRHSSLYGGGDGCAPTLQDCNVMELDVGTTFLYVAKSTFRTSVHPDSAQQPCSFHSSLFPRVVPPQIATTFTV
jgi:hypothetical protein